MFCFSGHPKILKSYCKTGQQIIDCGDENGLLQSTFLGGGGVCACIRVCSLMYHFYSVELLGPTVLSTFLLR